MDLQEFNKEAVEEESVKRKQNNGRKKNSETAKEEIPTCSQNTKYYLWEFCDRSSIHGLNFLGEKGRTVTERIWWIIIIVAALYICLTQIYQTYQKWINSPVIVTFSTTQTPIWDVPFPAVTICPEIKAVKNRFNYTDLYLKKETDQELNETETKEWEYMSLVCNTDSDLLNRSMTTTDKGAVDFLTEVAPDFMKFMFKVTWRGKEYKSEELRDLFSPILTSEGICYTFNIMDRTEIYSDLVTFPRNYFSTDGKFSKWSLESGYSEDADIDSYPRRTVVAGTKGGLNIIFRVDTEDLDYACGDSLQGFKVTLHNPTEIPRVKQKYFRIPLDQSVVASIKPNMMTTSNDIKYYNPVDRKCYFPTEKELKLYRTYNQENCLVECLTNFTLETCGCVGFHMAKTNTTPICGATKGKCMEELKGIFLANEVAEAVKQHEKSSPTQNSDSNSHDKCNCLPSCNSLDFDVETSQSDWDWRAYLAVLQQTTWWDDDEDAELLDKSNFARLALYFKDMQFIMSERNELYGQTDFWANCGGLLGLFCGFSFISAFEILYYLTLRIIFNVKKLGCRYWAGSEEISEPFDTKCM